ncbi:DNA-binding protein [Geomonas silvestris]|uniref:DNA-binding protein n=1 Tax=Geomonas silvestris TaxID=2740184 RepID=A0A6V8MKB0_9BACT|nr:helix-turn-helix domain-containing protein [Geomonas silvestris]GFO60465.1 DNA-binding protein [Geomonas silvestris]
MSEPEAEQVAELPVGDYLRGVRESRGLPLDEASRTTKISKSYLVAIEQGQFDKLPNQAYIKGFLRLYAQFLGLSGDEAVRRYEAGLPSARPAGQAEAKAEPERPRQVVERARLDGGGRWVVPVVLLALVIVAAFFFRESDEKPAPQVAKTAPAPAAPAPTPAPAAQPVQPPRSSAQLAPGTPAAPPAPSQAQAPQGAPAPAAAPAGTPAKRDGGVLRLKFNQDSWLSITIDDSISQRYDLKAGDIIEWKGKRSFVVDLGDGAAAEGDFNGRPLKLGESGKPAHVELKNE